MTHTVLDDPVHGDHREQRRPTQPGGHHGRHGGAALGQNSASEHGYDYGPGTDDVDEEWEKILAAVRPAGIEIGSRSRKEVFPGRGGKRRPPGSNGPGRR